MPNWIVELEPGVFLAETYGDPGRTLQIEHAVTYSSHARASRALRDAQKLRPFEFGRVTLAPDRNDQPNCAGINT